MLATVVSMSGEVDNFIAFHKECIASHYFHLESQIIDTSKSKLFADKHDNIK